jgi:8-oxo-dGTP pyrophosphatase MutT (NUDIX family)
MNPVRKVDHPDENGPWKVHERTIQYENEFGLKVFEDTVTRPDNKLGIYGFTSIPNGVLILPIDELCNVYLNRGFQYGAGIWSVEVVGGGIQNGEKSLDAAKRELKEELGITAGSWADIGTFYPLTGPIQCSNHGYIARELSFGEHNRGGTEVMEQEVISLREAVDKVLNGKIVDASTMAMILKADQLIGLSKLEQLTL